jgi:hypothetical protein
MLRAGPPPHPTAGDGQHHQETGNADGYGGSVACGIRNGGWRNLSHYSLKASEDNGAFFLEKGPLFPLRCINEYNALLTGGYL